MNQKKTITGKNIHIVLADYLDKQHAQDIVHLLNAYAIDPMGGGTALPPYVIENLATELSNIPNAFSIIGYVDNNAAGLINCFFGFSTFACKPLVNIHDIAVLSEYRGLGLSHRMLDKVEDIAKEKGCCKLTLEVLEGNTIAKQAYSNFGFEQYALDSTAGNALFWQKKLHVI